MDTINQIILYFFSPNPGRNFEYYWALIAIMVIFIVLTFGIYYYALKNKEDKAFKKLFRNYPTKFIILTVLFALYMFVRYNYVPFFSMRALMFILILSSIFVVYTGIQTYFKKYPEEKERRNKRKELNKYITTKKKKKK